MLSHIFFAIVVSAVGLSVAATLYVITAKGIAWESNPIIRWLYEKVGWPGVLLPRLIPLCLAFVAAYVVMPGYSAAWWLALLPYLALEVFIAQNDVRWAIKIHRRK